MTSHTYILKTKYALGDTILVTALARDIHRAYPGRFQLMVDTHWSAVWRNNPHIVPLSYAEQQRKDRTVVELAYNDGMGSSRRGSQAHFLSWWHRDFARKTGLTVPLTEPHGDIHLSDREKRPLIGGRYWVIVAGGKLDMTVKHYHAYQDVVDRLRPWGIRFVQVGARHKDHVHPKLSGVLDAVGRTDDVRDLFTLIHHADGVLCGVTGAMHAAACFDKPCVVVAGGRENPAWEAYTNAYFPHSFGPHCAPVKTAHRYLHTGGLLPCSKPTGCWTAHTVPLEPKHLHPDKKHLLCMAPEPSVPTPSCMAAIEPDHIAEAVISYYSAGILPPLH